MRSVFVVVGIVVSVLLYFLVAAWQSAGQLDAENQAAIRLLAEFHMERASRASELAEYADETDEFVGRYPHMRAIQQFGRIVRSGARAKEPAKRWVDRTSGD